MYYKKNWKKKNNIILLIIMGSTSSIFKQNYLYISYSSSCKENQYVSQFAEKLEEFNYNIINTKINDIFRDITTYQENIDSIIKNSHYIIVCISPQTISSVFQIIEMNKAWDNNKNIIYIMTDSNYTPETNSNLNRILKSHMWFPCYDEQTLTETLNLFTMIISK
jgi:hypothetical protein